MTLIRRISGIGGSARKWAPADTWCDRLKVPTNRVTEILNGQRAITADTALRLAHFFGTSAQFWLNLQNLYELRRAEEKVGIAIKRLPTLARGEQAHA